MKQVHSRSAILASLASSGLLALALLAPNAAFANNVGINGGACTYNTIELAAAAAASGDTLFVQPGVYGENTIVLNSKDLTIVSSEAVCAAETSQQVTIEPTAGQRGFELVNSDLTLKGLTVRLANTALNGATVHMEQNSTLELDDTILERSTSGGDGGCIYAAQSIINLMPGSKLDRCDATSDGGGAYLKLSTIRVFVGSSIQGCRAITGDGGGLYVGGSNAPIYGDVSDNDADDGGGLFVSIKDGIHSTVSFYGATVTGNTAENRGGGAYVAGSATQIRAFADALIENNTAAYGGGIYAVYDGGIFLNDDADVIGNHATGDGGGIFASGSDRLEFAGDDIGAIQIQANTTDGAGAGLYLSASVIDAEFVTVQENVATGAGGGLFLTGSQIAPARADFRNVRVLYNGAVRGAGIVVDGGDLDMQSSFTSCDPTTLPKGRFCSEIGHNNAVGGSSKGGGLRVINAGTAFVGTTSFAHNDAGVTGGAVAVLDSRSDVTLRNALIRDNQLGGGDAVAVQNGHLEILSTTFADNDVPVRYYAGSTGAFHRNIVWDNTSDAVLGGISGNCNTTQSPAGAPSGTNNDTLDPVFDTTDPRSARKLGATSTAINSCEAGPTTDLDGASRPLGAGFDKGAFEMPSCNSLYAAYVRDLGGLANCDAVSPVPFGELCTAGESPNGCLDRIYAAPPAPTNAGGGEMEYKYLPRCTDGTDVCPNPTVRCIDGTRPMAYVDHAMDDQGNDMNSNLWVFFMGGEGQPCDAGPNYYSTSCWRKYSGPNVDPGHRKALSSRHPDFPNDPSLNIEGEGITSPDYDIGGEINNFAHYNRIKFKRCAMGASEDALESASTSTAESATTYHRGVDIWKSLFRFLDTPAGRSLTNGDDLPPLSGATTVILAASSDAVLWLVQEADFLRQELEALSDSVDVRIVLDGYFDPMLENEARYNDPGFSNVFNSTFSNPNGNQLPQGVFRGSGREYDESTYDTDGSFRLNLDNRGVKVDESCLSFHGVGDDKKYCYDYLHVLLNHVTTPFFVVADQLDPTVRWIPIFPLDHERGGLSPPYAWRECPFRTRVLAQAKDIRDHHATSSEEAANQPVWNRGLYFTLPDAPQHTHLGHQSRFFGDGEARMLKCDGANQLASVAISDAIFQWVTYDTGIAAIEDPSASTGLHWVTNDTTCGNPR